MGLLGKLSTAGFIGIDLVKYQPKEKGLFTFHGWEGQWWKRIKPGKALFDAVTTVGPAKVWIPAMAGQWIWNAARKRWQRRRRKRRY